MTKTPDMSIAPYIRAVFEKKAENHVILDVRGLTSIADVLVIVSGHSSRHVAAIAESILDVLAREGKKPISKEGIKEGRWALLDFGHVVIHVFFEPVRILYDIEGLWSDAPRMSPEPYLF